jgi:RNA polymerase sigma-70 factor (ECF subfamily)
MYISMELPHHVGKESGRLSALPVGNSIEVKRKAYSEIALRYQSDLLQTARRLCQGNEDRAQDHVQDALIRGYEAFLNGKFMEGSNARAWLIRILTNSFINAYRRSKRWDAAIDVDTLTSGGEAGPASTHVPNSEIPGQALIEDTLDDNLEKALNGLSNGLRVCVILVDIEGLDYAEAAAALDIPVGTVRSRLSRARIQLHESLREFAQDRRLI